MTPLNEAGPGGFPAAGARVSVTLPGALLVTTPPGLPAASASEATVWLTPFRSSVAPLAI